MARAKGPIPHGTAGGYTNHGCRCPRCRKAWREYHRAYMDRHPEQRERHAERQRTEYRRRKQRKGTV